MDLTAGDASVFTEGTVAEVLRVAKESLRADLEEQLARERSKLCDTEHAVAALEQQQTERRERMNARAARAADTASAVACVGLLVLLAAGALLTFPWSLPQLKRAWYRYLTTGLLVAFFVFTVANVAWGTSVRSLRESLKGWLARRIRRWLSAITE
jgi:hypothetical protein